MRSVIGYLAFALGALVSVLNFYLSWIRMPLLRAFGRTPKRMSGFPFVGSLLLLIALILFWDNRPLALTAALLALIDTGGPHWYLGGQLWHALMDGASKQ
jgi:hypothetical protein